MDMVEICTHEFGDFGRGLPDTTKSRTADEVNARTGLSDAPEDSMPFSMRKQYTPPPQPPVPTAQITVYEERRRS
jgi:hypothetical protein